MGELYHEMSSVIRFKKGLIRACELCKPSLLFPALLTPNVKVAFPNKVRFYKYFKFIIKEAKKNKLDNELTLKIEAPYEINLKGGKNYCFYDGKQKAPLIIIEIKETGNLLYVDIHPF